MSVLPLCQDPEPAFVAARLPLFGNRHRSLKDGDDGAAVGLLHESLDRVRLQGGHQGLDGGVLLPALGHGQHVDVGGARGPVGGLDGQGVGHVQAGLDGIVAVDDGQVQAVQGAGQLGGLHLHDLKAPGIVFDVQPGGLQARAVLQGDEALLLEKQEGAAAVGGVVGNADLGAVLPA